MRFLDKRVGDITLEDDTYIIYIYDINDPRVHTVLRGTVSGYVCFLRLEQP